MSIFGAANYSLPSNIIIFLLLPIRLFFFFFQEYDIDWDNQDTKKLVALLKPVASSKACVYQNTKLREKQESARLALNSALAKIAPLVDDTFDLVSYSGFASLKDIEM